MGEMWERQSGQKDDITWVKGAKFVVLINDVPAFGWHGWGCFTGAYLAMI